MGLRPEVKVLLRAWLKALLDLSWVGLPAGALVGEPAAAAALLLLGERAMLDVAFVWCDLWKDNNFEGALLGFGTAGQASRKGPRWDSCLVTFLAE